jgi:uncharacterized lipoprotein YddW (UPF0748 family)
VERTLIAYTRKELPVLLRVHNPCQLACFALICSLIGYLPNKSDVRRADPPKEEMRGLWVARWSITSPEACTNIVASAATHHFNTLFVQARGRGDAYYHSDLEPRGQALNGKPSSFDPLSLMVSEGHKRGLKVHAWLNTYLTWTGATPPSSRSHIIRAHSDWIARDRDGHCDPENREQCEGLFTQPSNPQVQEHLHRVFTDVASRYDLDGIHFDFVRYPNKDYDFSAPTLARFKAYMDPRLSDAGRAAVSADHSRFAYVHMFPKEWEAWRRDQVTGLVKRISAGVHEMKPWIEVTAAVFANSEDASKERGQDWKSWLADGTLDGVCLMAYSKNTETVAKQTAQALAVANGRHVYTGIGSWRLSAADTIGKISSVRSAGAQGIALFSYDGITRNGRSSEYLDKLTRGSFASRSAPPGMRWLKQRP